MVNFVVNFFVNLKEEKNNNTQTALMLNMFFRHFRSSEHVRDIIRQIVLYQRDEVVSIWFVVFTGGGRRFMHTWARAQHEHQSQLQGIIINSRESQIHSCVCLCGKNMIPHANVMRW